MRWRPAALGLLLAACGGASPPSGNAPTGARASASPTASAVESAGGSPELESAPADGAPSPPARGDPLLRELARSREPELTLRLGRVGEELLLIAGPHVLPVREDRVHVEDDYSDGLGAFGEVIAVGGRWPDDAWLTYVTSDGRIGWGELYRWKRSAWRKQATLPHGEVYLGISAWSRGRLLTLSTDVVPFRQPARHTFRVVGGGAAPVLAPGRGPCATETHPHGFTALETGHVFVVGVRCGPDPLEGSVAEWWAPDAKRSTVTPLPGVKLGGAWYDETPVVAAALGEHDVLLGAGSFLARFDGGAFHPLDTPGGHVSALARTDDGTVWAAFDGTAYRRDAGGIWHPEPLPGDPKVTSIVARGRHVYVSAGVSLYGSARATGSPQLFELPERTAPKSFQVARAADQHCESIFALLYAFTRFTPDHYDFPLTRRALQGQTRFSGARFVVTEEGGTKYLGAFAPSLEMGRALVEHLTATVKGSKPSLLCATPRVVREFPIDLATGELSQ